MRYTDSCKMENNSAKGYNPTQSRALIHIGYRPSPQLADLLVIPVILALSILPLLWFSRSWWVNPDSPWYLLQGVNLISGKGLTLFGKLAEPLRGPVFPFIMGILTSLIGPNVTRIVWVMRMVPIADALLFYLLVRWVAGRVAGLLSAALFVYFGYAAMLAHALSVDTVQIFFYLTSLILLVWGGARCNTPVTFLSGIALGLAILTKESAVVALPVAAVAALILERRGREVIAHYVGLLGVCAPWWIWVWQQTGKVYLLQSGQVHPENVDTPKLLAIVGGAALFSVALVTWYARRRSPSSFANGRVRGAIAWALTLAWVVAMSYILLKPPHETIFSSLSTAEYLSSKVLASTPAWFLLPLGIIFIGWSAATGDRKWSFYSALLAMWLPVVLLLVVLHYRERQYMLPEMLLYGALSGCTITVGRVALSKARLRPRLPAIGLFSIILASLLVVTGMRTHSLLTKPDPTRYQVDNRYNTSVQSTSVWIARNIPAGATIWLMNPYSKQLAYLDGKKHVFKLFRQSGSASITKRFSRKQVLQMASCLRGSGKDTCNETTGVFWASVTPACRMQVATLTPVYQVVDKDGAKYILLTDWTDADKIRDWGSWLDNSRALKVSFASYIDGGGLLVLEATGRKSADLPVEMSMTSRRHLKWCLRKNPSGLNGLFPQGVHTIPAESDTMSRLDNREATP